MVDSIYLFCLFLVVHVWAEPGMFYNPPTGGPIHDYSEDPVYTLEQTVQLRWATSLKYFSLMLWQNDNPDYEWLQTNLHGVTSYDWIVSTQRNLSDGAVFFFQIRDATDLDNEDGIFASHYFNITGKETTTTAAGASTTTRTTASTSAPTISSVALTASVAVTASTVPAETTTPAATPSGTSTGTKVGIGVGVGVGCALLGASALAWYLLRRRKKESGSETRAPMSPASGTVPSYELLASPKVAESSHAPVPTLVEMSGPVESRYELPS